MDFSYLPTLTVDLDALTFNLISMANQAKVALRKVIAVVKDGGYGLGSYEVATTFVDAGVQYLGVARFDEALYLRERGITAAILVFGPTTLEEVVLASRHEIIVTLHNRYQLEEIALSKVDLPQFHLFVDTGMARNGLTFTQLSTLSVRANIHRLRNNIVGVYTHLHSADSSDIAPVIAQRTIFEKAQKLIAEEGIVDPMVHTSNSAASMYAEVPQGEYIRPGIALYGCRPDPNRRTPNFIREVIQLTSRVSSIRPIKVGEGCSYGHTWLAESDTRIATIPIGYGDGYPRHLSNCGMVLINGVLFPIVGRVTMDHIMVEIGDASVKKDDEVVLIGRSGGLRITTDELALKAETIGYELLCRIGSQVRKEYLKGGQVAMVKERFVG